MLSQSHHDLVVPTRGRGFVDVTADLTAFLDSARAGDGVLTVFCTHTSASLVIQENADPTVRADLERFFSRLVRDGDSIFQHTEEGPDDMSAHVRAALTQTQLSIPVKAGALTLGRWQAVYLWEHRTSPHRRTLSLHYLGTVG
ncbi:MAG: YjbQ family protein [Archangiaceae bacterium]|nr:YjbQ family protein [Archangiaceae bacterium]